MQTIKFNGETITSSKVICVGQNYLTHIREMGGNEIPEEPVLFLKPNSAIRYNPQEITIPASLGLLHHEVELCFLIGKKGCNIPVEQAQEYIAAYCIGIDFTLRDRQNVARKSGLPWDLAKGFDASGIYGELVACDKLSNINNLDVSLTLNGKLRQQGHTSDLLRKPNELLSYASRFVTLEVGDLFMTGTPKGVGAVEDGDRILAEISTLPSLEFIVHRS